MNDTNFSTKTSRVMDIKIKEPDAGLLSIDEQIQKYSHKTQPTKFDNKPIAVLFQQALKAHKLGELKYAKDLYAYILTLQPIHANTLHALGMLAAEQQQWDSAIAWIQKALAIEPNSAVFHHHLANVFKNSGNLESALSHYRTALYWNPQYAEAHNNIANLLYKKNKLIEAHQHYAQAIHLKPDYLEAHFNLGLLFLAQQEKEPAITQFNKVLKLHPDFIQAHWQLAIIYWQDKHLDKIQYHYQEIIKQDPTSPEVLNNLAVLMLKKNQQNSAIDYFKQVLAIAPKHKTARNNLATCLLQKNQFKEAIWHYSLYLNLEPLDKEALFNRAHGLMLTGQLDEAIQDLKKILTIDKEHIDTHCNLSAIYLKLGNKTEALKQYQIILNLDAKHPIASYMMSALTQQSMPINAPLEYVKNLFNNYAFQFDMHLRNILSYKTPELLREYLTPFLKNKKYQVLDLGCGTGLSGLPFVDISKSLIGIDISTNMLNKAKEKACYNILIENDILNGLTGLDQYFDLILCIDTLVYFGDLSELFAKIISCLQKNSLLAFSIELADETKSSYSLQTTGRYQHTEYYIKELAKKNNLKLLKFLSVEGRHQENNTVNTGLFILKK